MSDYSNGHPHEKSVCDCAWQSTNYAKGCGSYEEHNIVKDVCVICGHDKSCHPEYNTQIGKSNTEQEG